MEDEDLKRHFSRDELEELIEPSVANLKVCLEEFFTKSGKLNIHISFTQIRVVASQFFYHGIGVLS